MSIRRKASEFLRDVREYGGEECADDVVSDIADDFRATEQENTKLKAKLRDYFNALDAAESFRRDRNESAKMLACQDAALEYAEELRELIKP